MIRNLQNTIMTEKTWAIESKILKILKYFQKTMLFPKEPTFILLIFPINPIDIPILLHHIILNSNA